MLGAQVTSEPTAEHEVVGCCEPVSLAEVCEDLGDLSHHWDSALATALWSSFSAVREVAADVDQLKSEVEVAPAQCEQLALSQTTERRGEVDRGVLLGLRSADQGRDLVAREHVDVRRSDETRPFD